MAVIVIGAFGSSSLALTDTSRDEERVSLTITLAIECARVRKKASFGCMIVTAKPPLRALITLRPVSRSSYLHDARADSLDVDM